MVPEPSPRLRLDCAGTGRVGRPGSTDACGLLGGITAMHLDEAKCLLISH